jgi:flagellum-specific peptidoglycan hydrolase FlgJ
VPAQEDLLPHAEIEELSKQVASMGSASQGDFLDRIHQEAERKVAAHGALPHGSLAPRGRGRQSGDGD